MRLPGTKDHSGLTALTTNDRQPITSSNYATAISTYVSVFRQRNGTRASQYFALIARRTLGVSLNGSMRAVPANSGPVIFPESCTGQS